MAQGHIRVGIGGWIFEPWRGRFYPEALPKKQELEHASRHVTTIEINGTFYRAQTPRTYARWASETPDDFVFSLKASRYACNRKNLAEAGESIERFVASGITAMEAKLGPILWQFAATKRYDPVEIEGFLSALPTTRDGIKLRHVIEPRHASFQTPDFVALARRHGVVIVLALSDDYPMIADPTANFCYLRLQTTSATEAAGYDAATIDLWARRLVDLAAGETARDLPTLTDAPEIEPRDVFAYMIAGAKETNPAAARALLDRLSASTHPTGPRTGP